MEERKDKVIGIVGDYDWEMTRDVLVFQLMKCETEEDFMKVIETILTATGTSQELKKMRKTLRIKKFDEDELEFMKEKIKSAREKNG